jgi:hypothetical protein
LIKKVKKYTLIALTMFICIAFNSIGVLADDDSVLNLGTRTITDVNKTWTITFKEDVDFTSVQNNIQIKDVTTGNIISITPIQGESKSIVKVNAPSGGYTVGHSYKISVNKNIKFANNTFLPQTIEVTFLVISKDTNNYTVSANVTVSPAINIFKQITITSTNLPGAEKYKIEGNNTLVDIGKSMFSVVPGNTVKVYICDSLGNIIGTANMDVSTTKSNMSLNLQ